MAMAMTQKVCSPSQNEQNLKRQPLGTIFNIF